MVNYSCLLARTLVDPIGLSTTVTASYIVFYTGFSKTEKTLKPSQIADVVLFRKGVDYSLVEYNKAISLTGLTLMLISFLPEYSRRFQVQSKQLLWISMNMLWAHSVYSFYKFYELELSKVYSAKGLKGISVLFGAAGQIALSLGYWGKITESALIAAASTLSIAHFWTMEVDYKYKLQVRPYAYLPFPLAAYALYSYFGKKD